MIITTVTRPRRHSDDLMQEGLELPCKNKFTGPDEVIKITHRLLNDEHNGVSELQGIVLLISVVIAARLALVAILEALDKFNLQPTGGVGWGSCNWLYMNSILTCNLKPRV